MQFKHLLMASIWTYKVHWVGKKKSTEWTSFSRIQLFVTPMNCGILSFFFFSSTTLLLPTHLPPPPCTHAQSCNPMDCSPPGSCVHGLFQARILEWAAISFSSRPEYWSGYPFLSPGDLPNPGIEPRSPTLQADFFTSWATRETQEYWSG